MSFLASLGEQVPSEFPVDRISCLPCEVLNIILDKLPLFDAVRTCVLAKGWRYKWLMLSKFFLDYELISDDTKDLKWDVIFCVTNNYLLNHTGTIKTFYLRTFCWPHYPELYQWLLYLSKLQLEVLLLEELGSQPFEMPSYMFRFKKLRSLFLGNCTLRTPSTFGSFSTLFELSLRDVSINDDDLHHLLLRCPLLVKLTLLRIHGLDHLRIHSPSLTMLEIDTRIEDVVIESFACLVLVCIKNSFGYPGMVRSWRSVIRCLSGLDSLLRLGLYGEFITILAADCALENFPLRNDTLTCLSLCDVRFETIEVLRVCLSLLSFCTIIKSFQFSIEAAKAPKLITTYLKEIRGRFSFPLLDSIAVTFPSGMGCAVNFIEFLCAHSPNLKDICIVKGGKLHTDRTHKMFSRFDKICPNAKVKYTQKNKSICDLHLITLK